MKATWPVLATLFLTSCGFFKSDSQKIMGQNEREIASIGAKQLVESDEKHFREAIEDKLQALHSYYLIGYKNLEQFDQEAKEGDTSKIYVSDSYLNLMAVRTQVEEIEDELKEAFHLGQKSSFTQVKMRFLIQKFAEKSSYSMLSMENLQHQLNIQTPNSPSSKGKSFIMKKSLEAELKSMEESKEFAVFEKNIEHLSHMLDIKIENNSKKFFPSNEKSGNIVGTEFPAKVWSLTFDDGPGADTTHTILKNLMKRDLKATFFQLNQKVKQEPRVKVDDKMVRVTDLLKNSGMEIASHSWTHQQLTKVGPIGLEKEITDAVKKLEEFYGIDIKYFRLPYGAGVNSAHIRNIITNNNLVHVFWNVDTLDWMPQGPSKIVDRALTLMKKTSKDAGVILFHDIHKRTAEAAPQIMDFLKKDGRRVCTLDEIVTQMNEGAETVCPSK